MAVTIKPLEDRILVQPLEAEQTTAYGLVIPDTAKEKPQRGEIVASEVAGTLGSRKIEPALHGATEPKGAVPVSHDAP